MMSAGVMLIIKLFESREAAFNSLSNSFWPEEIKTHVPDGVESQVISNSGQKRSKMQAELEQDLIFYNSDTLYKVP